MCVPFIGRNRLRLSLTESELGSQHFPLLILPPGRLIHDAALQCFQSLKHDVNHSSVAATLRYLTCVLPYAALSSDLEAACNPQEPFAYATTEDPAISDLVQEVGIAIKKLQGKVV
jgi:hypothetical protein